MEWIIENWKSLATLAIALIAIGNWLDKRFKKYLDPIYSSLGILTDQVKEIRGEIKDIKSEIKEIRSDIKGIDTRISRMEGVIECSNKIIYIKHEEELKEE